MPQVVMIQRLISSGSVPCANATNWCRVGKALFARNRRGSTTACRFRNSTGCRRGDAVVSRRLRLCCSGRRLGG
jgi:hypothetical protein